MIGASRFSVFFFGSGRYQALLDNPAIRHAFTIDSDQTVISYLTAQRLEEGKPQSFNRYSYVSNDPVNFVVPTGLYEACAHEAMTRFLGALAGLPDNVSDRLALFAGDRDVNSADAPKWKATSPRNYDKCLFGHGPTLKLHFPSAAQLKANKASYVRNMKLANYMTAGHMIHSMQDGFGAHNGYSNRGCLGHAVDLLSLQNPHNTDRELGDADFVRAASETLNLMLEGQGLETTSMISDKTINQLIDAIIEACGGDKTRWIITRPSGSGRGGGFAIGGQRPYPRTIDIYDEFPHPHRGRTP